MLFLTSVRKLSKSVRKDDDFFQCRDTLQSEYSSVNRLSDEGDSHNRFLCASEEAQNELAVLFLQSKLFTSWHDNHNWANLPRYKADEIVIGEILGSGTFCDVKAISSFASGQRQFEETHGAVEKREMAFSSTKRSGCIFPPGIGQLSTAWQCVRRNHQRIEERRYAIKTFKKESLDSSESFIVAATDLALEAHILSVLDHPNIVRLCGLSTDLPATKNFFIVMDRLYERLDERFRKWRKQKNNQEKLVRSVLPRTKVQKRQKLFYERLAVGAALANAMEHLHSRNIIHRDLKPDNIGFDANDKVKIFDFGLARELNPDCKRIDGTYSMTGETGTMRYMAPEVYRNQPYNEAVDIYSFSLILWEIFSLETPFAGYNMRMMTEVVFEREFRPNINAAWPESLQILIRNSWKAAFRDRPTAATVYNILKAELPLTTNENDSNVETISNQGEVRTESSGVLTVPSCTSTSFVPIDQNGWMPEFKTSRREVSCCTEIKNGLCPQQQLTSKAA